MNRYSPLRRSTPLRAKARMKRSEPGQTTRKRVRNTGPSQKVRDDVKARSGGVCERCNQAKATEVHHRLGRRNGGSRDPRINWLSNLSHLCSPCHRWATVNRTDPHMEGWVLFSGDCPRHVPALVGPRPGIWRTFDDEGGWCSHGPEWPEIDPCDCLGHPGWCSIWEPNSTTCNCAPITTDPRVG